jgi:molybdopterin-containing oxidoreductase family membrane subunit
MKPWGRLGFALGLVVLLAMAAVGVYAYALQIQGGEVVSGMRGVGAGGAVWGLYVVMDGCFLGAGVALMAAACIARFSRDRAMEAAARIAMPPSIACCLGAALSVMADQGRPLAALVNLSLYARPQSPMFVTFTAVGAICLFGSLVHCVLARRPDLAEYAKRPSRWQGLQRLFAAGYKGTPVQRYRRKKAGFWMSLFMLPALVAPATALASLFVVRPARSIDVVLLEVAAFLAVSFAGGIAVLVIAAALVEKLAGREAGLPARGYARLGRWLLAAVALSLLLVVAAEIASVSSTEGAVAAYGRALLHDFGGMFWGAVGSLFVAAGLLWRAARRRQGRLSTAVLASLMVEVALFLHHYYLLVAWQTHGLALPYPAGTYSPTRIEYAVVLGIVAVCILLLLPAVRLIPFAPLAIASQQKPKKVRDGRRTLLTSIWLVVGMATLGVGLAGAARVGTDSFMDPVLTGSPVFFIVGLMMLATTGALYELMPERPRHG